MVLENRCTLVEEGVGEVGHLRMQGHWLGKFSCNDEGMRVVEDLRGQRRVQVDQVVLVDQAPQLYLESRLVP